jgi:hypothetical protein
MGCAGGSLWAAPLCVFCRASPARPAGSFQERRCGPPAPTHLSSRGPAGSAVTSLPALLPTATAASAAPSRWCCDAAMNLDACYECLELRELQPGSLRSRCLKFVRGAALECGICQDPQWPLLYYRPLSRRSLGTSRPHGERTKYTGQNQGDSRAPRGPARPMAIQTRSRRRLRPPRALRAGARWRRPLPRRRQGSGRCTRPVVVCTPTHPSTIRSRPIAGSGAGRRPMGCSFLQPTHALGCGSCSPWNCMIQRLLADDPPGWNALDRKLTRSARDDVSRIQTLSRARSLLCRGRLHAEMRAWGGGGHAAGPVAMRDFQAA